MTYMQIFPSKKQHYGNTVIGVYLQYGQYASKYVIRKTQMAHNLYPDNEILDVLIYFYQNFKNYNPELIVTRNSTYQTLLHLHKWNKEGWPVSQFDSNQLYNQAQRNGTRMDFSKIPSNYVKNMNTLKKLFKMICVFRGRLRISRVTPKPAQVKQLDQFLASYVRGSKPSKVYVQHGRAEIGVLTTPKIKKEFTLACKRTGTTPKELLNKSIKGYIQKYLK